MYCPFNAFTRNATADRAAREAMITPPDIDRHGRLPPGLWHETDFAIRPPASGSRSEFEAEDPERIAIREALAFGKALYDRRMALGLSVAALAERAGMVEDEIECIEEGGTAPTIPLLRQLAAALDADVRLTAGHDLGSIWFEAHAA
ncbi:helix-turn-helix domain-containing protein [Microtetraspora malaysiensis]|uniref:helix-turn-helix domain-containing protein n=1 Tax=Microtetraspora malaysiensis TaxID=161358 RepID=UPI003D932AA3